MFIKVKAQGILEYALLLGAIVAVIVIVLVKQGGIGSSVHDSYINLGNSIKTTTGDLTKSF